MKSTGVAMVTAAATVAGRRYCEQLAETMNRVIAVTDSACALDDFDLSAKTDWQVLEADLSSTEGQARVLEAIRQQGPLECLVNCSDTFVSAGVVLLPEPLAVIRRRTEAIVVLTQAALGFMQAQGCGYIVQVLENEGSLGGTHEEAIASACTAFVREYTQSLQAQLQHQPDVVVEIVDGSK